MRMRTAIGALAAVAAVSLIDTAESQASSHKEAPFITKNPKVDGTDFYMFQSYSADRLSVPDGNGATTSDYTTILANYIPLQDPAGGPNFFTFDPEALYEIHVENSGDAVEDITFQFQFKNALAGGGKGVLLPSGGGKSNSIPFVQGNLNPHTSPPNPITAANEATLLNVQESYTVNVVKGPRRGSAGILAKNTATSGTTFIKPVDYIGARTNGGAAAYKTYASAHQYAFTFDGCDTPAKVFVGQRQEGFKVNLGVVFDLVNADLGTLLDGTKRNAFNGGPLDATYQKNISTLALEIPTKCLTSDGQAPATSARPILGGWTTASVRQARVINPDATYDKPAKEGGAWAQVSRLGMPLVNEVVIGIGDKDKFNSSEPSKDTQFLDYVTQPTLPIVLGAIFGAANFPSQETKPRADLVAIFLNGVPNVNATGSTAEMLRLNTKLPVKGTGVQTGGSSFATNPYSGLGAALCFNPVKNCAPAGKTLTDCVTVDPIVAAACDTGGFPNGRRPGDDVVDISLTAVLGYFTPQAPAYVDGVKVLHDGVLNEESQFDPAFPYLKTPFSGDPEPQ